MQVQTMDSFFTKGIIDDALIYLEHVPDEYVSGKDELMRELRYKRMKDEQMSMAQNPMSTAIPKGGAKL